MTIKKPQVLIIYYTHTQQARRVADKTADVLRDRGCDVRLTAIEFVDPRYARRFANFPFGRLYRDLFVMLAPQLRRATGQITLSEEALAGEYDLICVGSPTWWLTTCMPVRSFMKSDAAAKLFKGKKFAAYVVCRRYWRNNLNTVTALGIGHGARLIRGAHFVYAGGQIRSMLALLSYYGSGEYKQSSPGPNLKPDFGQSPPPLRTIWQTIFLPRRRLQVGRRLRPLLPDPAFVLGRWFGVTRSDAERA
jgi:menaquinone-dependent protoporphyrinogen IX oxidase